MRVSPGGIDKRALPIDNATAETTGGGHGDARYEVKPVRAIILTLNRSHAAARTLTTRDWTKK